MFAKVLTATALAAALTVGLTACDPPMPPDVLAALAEQTVACESGEVTVAFPASLADLTGSWTSALADSCTDMAMTPVAADDVTAAVFVSGNGVVPAECKAFETVPLAQDGSVVAFLNSEISSLNLTPALIADIFSGKISNWNDKAIAAANDGLVLSDLPINVLPTVQENTLTATNAWLAAEGVTAKLTSLTAVPDDDGASLMAMAEGDISLTTYSNALYNYSTVATVLKGREALAYLGGFTIDAHLCGEDTLVKRAVVRYLLRQDSQGALVSGVVLSLPEQVRLDAIAKVSKGLPTPEPMPTEG